MVDKARKGSAADEGEDGDGRAGTHDADGDNDDANSQFQ